MLSGHSGIIFRNLFWSDLAGCNQCRYVVIWDPGVTNRRMTPEAMLVDAEPFSGSAKINDDPILMRMRELIHNVDKRWEDHVMLNAQEISDLFPVCFH
ncbi:hypothetical protein COFR110785_07510 [Corynebacterium frankenforstense]